MDFIGLLATQPTGLWHTIIYWFSSFINSYGWAIILFTVCLKLVLSPLDFFQKAAMRKTQRQQAMLKPELDKIKEKYGNNKEIINQKTMELYRKNNVSPAGGCLPMLISLVVTMVVFFTLFSAMNQISQFKIQDEYEKLSATYQASYEANYTANKDYYDTNFVGGSDIKVSAVKDGKVLSSEEIVWLPKLNENINYHYDYFYDAMKKAIDVLGGDVDAIGISAAGVIVNNRPMVSSIFIKVPKEDFAKVKGAYINTVKRLERELGHEIPFEVANDGDVTALAGALDLRDNCVLGIAMGTSEAVGYVDKSFNLPGWFSELAFMPVDFNKDAMVDEWSKDYGVGCKYFSQDAVIKLAPRAGIQFDESLTLAEKLKYVQKLNDEGFEGANKIFESIGVYLAYTLAFYAEFYEIKHVILLGRVTSGKGGTTY